VLGVTSEYEAGPLQNSSAWQVLKGHVRKQPHPRQRTVVLAMPPNESWRDLARYPLPPHIAADRVAKLAVPRVTAESRATDQPTALVSNPPLSPARIDLLAQVRREEIPGFFSRLRTPAPDIAHRFRIRVQQGQFVEILLDPGCQREPVRGKYRPSLHATDYPAAR
jgi:hypothetical protein